MAEHRFGGPWTQLKLDVLRKHLHFYAKALKNQNFRLIYIDAFAGSGSSTFDMDGEEIKLDGSASETLNSRYLKHVKKYSLRKPLGGISRLFIYKKRCKIRY